MPEDPEKRRASRARYDASEKGRARHLRYWHKPGGGRHQRREREAREFDRKIEEILATHPDLRSRNAPRP